MDAFGRCCVQKLLVKVNLISVFSDGLNKASFSMKIGAIITFFLKNSGKRVFVFRKAFFSWTAHQKKATL